jgi:cobalamin-dependent methionine synthase I
VAHRSEHEATVSSPFTIIGENVHATRIIRRADQRVGTDELGREAIAFVDRAGSPRHLPISDAEQQSANYEDGKIKHVRMAIRTAMGDGEPHASTARAYLEKIVRDQMAAGADYLDLNIDEVSLERTEQIGAMRWLVRAVREWTDLPVAIDSPSGDILAAGIDEASSGPRRPMVNSASLERPQALDLARDAGGPVVVTASGEAGMPSDADGRVENATRIVELALGHGIELDQIHVDPLVFPIAVDGASGAHCLSSISALRERYGPTIRLTGGMSNVSFGLPQRQLLNDAFLALAIEAGADCGILDPVANPPSRALALDRSLRPVQLALDAVTGADRNCRAYLRAYRAGELAVAAA